MLQKRPQALPLTPTMAIKSATLISVNSIPLPSASKIRQLESVTGWCLVGDLAGLGH
jgi:hypothetical protein